MGSVHPVMKKMAATQRYVTTISFFSFCELGTWTCDARSMKKLRANRNHWSTTKNLIFER